MANGDLIQQVREQLQNPKGVSAKAAQILTLSLLADLYDKWADDHKKIDVMWNWFRPFAFIAGAIAVAVIGVAVTGHVQINIIP